MQVFYDILTAVVRPIGTWNNSSFFVSLSATDRAVLAGKFFMGAGVTSCEKFKNTLNCYGSCGILADD